MDGFTGKWGKKKWFKELGLRILHGVPNHLVYLCQIPQVGKVRATKLWNAGLRNIDLVANNPDKVKACLGVKKELLEEIVTGASLLSSSS